MSTATPRLAQPSDKDRLLDLRLRLSADGQAADRRYVHASHAAEEADDFINGWVTGVQPTSVAEMSGQLVEFIVTKPLAPHRVLDLPATLQITDAYVLDEFRRQGRGRLLHATVGDDALAEGFRRSRSAH